MAVGDKHRYKVAKIVPRHFEQTAKDSGFPIAALHEVMAEIVKQLPEAIGTVQKALDPSTPEAMVGAITTAAMRRAGEIESYLRE